MSPQRTYWHLEPKKRIPSSYEIATSNLLYHASQGFEIEVPVKPWYVRYQQESAFRCQHFETFCDPRATTYTQYVDLQSRQEGFIDQIFEMIERTAYDQSLEMGWIASLDQILPQQRFFFHGLQMVAAYVGQMAPDSKITVAATLQAADEMRRIQCIAYRMRLLQHVYPEFGQNSQQCWHQDSIWQPLRKLLEELLVTYDWGEAFVALNLVTKPIFDELFQSALANMAQNHGDFQLANILRSLLEDCRWHAQWSRALLHVVLRDTPSTGQSVCTWAAKWYAEAADAYMGFTKIIDTADELPAFAHAAARLGIQPYD